MASVGLDSSASVIPHPLEVVANRHPSHGEVRPRMTPARLGYALAAPLLPFGQRFAAPAISRSVFRSRFPPATFRAPSRRPRSARTSRGYSHVEDAVRVRDVVRRGSVGLDPSDQLVTLADVDRKLVSKVALAALLRAGRAPFRQLKISPKLSLLDWLFLPAYVVLIGGRNYRGVDDLTDAHDAPFRSSVAVEMLRSQDTGSSEALSGGNNLATTLSLNACPYLATSFLRYRPCVSDSTEATTIPRPVDLETPAYWISTVKIKLH